MDKERKTEKGYHIKEFPAKARKLARAGAILEGVSVGEWIARAVRERWQRTNGEVGDRASRRQKAGQQAPVERCDQVAGPAAGNGETR